MHRRPALAAGLLATVALTACSTATSGTPRSAPTRHTAAPRSSTPAPSAQTVALTRTVLAAADIGHGFTAAEPDGSIDALPCTADVAPVKAAALEVAASEFVDVAGTAQIDEQVMRFPSRSDAGVAAQTVQGGYGCSRAGTVDILGPTDISAELTAGGLDQAQAWQLGFGRNAGVVMLVQLEDRLISLHFLARVGSSQTVRPQEVAAAAVAKVVNGG